MVTFQTPNKYEKKVELQKCVFWSEMEQRWSAEGCCLERRATSPSGTTECHCNHLTNFALLVVSWTLNVLNTGLSLL